MESLSQVTTGSQLPEIELAQPACALRDGEIEATLSRTGHAPGVVVRSGRAAYYAAIYDTEARALVFPFAHTFRKGSRLRIWIEAPTGHTGFWAFKPILDPATNTVLHNATHPSRLVVGVVPKARARALLPACDTLSNQPCRSDPLAV